MKKNLFFNNISDIFDPAVCWNACHLVLGLPAGGRHVHYPLPNSWFLCRSANSAQ